MYDFKVTNPGRELGIKAGDVIRVTEMKNADGWWHGRIGDKWGAFPFSYVHCVLKFGGQDYLVLPAGWAVHKSNGDKVKVGTYDVAKKTLTKPTGDVEDWSKGYLVGSPDAAYAKSFLGAEKNDVRGLAGVDDDVEDALKVTATELAGDDKGSPAGPVQAVADDADKNATICCHAVAMFDFTGSDPSRDLNLKAGDVISVNEMDNSDGWWHGKVGDSWGAFPFSYVHCVLKFGGDDFLLMPTDWAVHTAAGGKEKVGTYDTEKKTLTKPDGSVADWKGAKLV